MKAKLILDRIGSLIGQLAKLEGCRAIDFSGSDEKCQFLSELGFDAAL